MGWTKEECDVADWIRKAYKQKYTSIANIQSCISKQDGKNNTLEGIK